MLANNIQKRQEEGAFSFGGDADIWSLCDFFHKIKKLRLMPNNIKNYHSDDVSSLQARLNYVERQYKSLQLNMKYQREAFLKILQDNFLLKLVPRRCRTLDRVYQFYVGEQKWHQIMQRHPFKFDLWWTARKLQQNHRPQATASTTESNGNIDADKHALTLRHIETMLPGKKVSHIFFMPFITRGGSKKYILNIINELCRQTPLTSILVIAGSDYTGITWEKQFPVNVDYVDPSIFLPRSGMDER